jgi:hypothetical protein
MKYSTGTGWIDDRKPQQHTMQHEPFLCSKSFKNEHTGLTSRSVFTSDHNRQHRNCLRATKVSSHDKQACTTVTASTEVQYWHRMDWRQKRTTAHNATLTFSSFKIIQKRTHRTHPSFCIYLRQRWISETTLEVMKFRMRRILSMDGDRVIESTLCDRVCKNYAQIQVGTTVQRTSTNTWSRNHRENCTGYM